MEYIILGLYYACSNFGKVIDLIEDYNRSDNVTVEDIDNIYLIPSSFIPITIGQDEDYIDLTFALSQSGGFHQAITLEDSISKPSSIDGYIPKNKKLLTNEFNYLVVSNEVGATENLAYENFKSSRCNFFLSAIPTATGNALLTPQSYGNISGEPFNYDYGIYGIPLGKFPMISINFDYYRLWLDKNIFNLTTGAIESGIESLAGLGQITAGAFTGDIDGVVSGLGRTSNIYGFAYNLYKEMYNKKKIPPVTISQTSSSEVMASGRYNYLGFSFYQFCIEREYAEIIDEYFSKFGYKTLKNKIPNITGRSNWNYVKTIEAVVDSSTVPEKYLNEYKQMLNNGITFWHNPLSFLDYSQTNSII